MSYEPIIKHWFYKVNDNIWSPFSYKDSAAIQQSYENNGAEIISTDFGHYKVNIKEKKRIAVYWKGEENDIRYCSWFYKIKNKNYLPYDEDISNLLEEEYKKAVINNKWNAQIKLANNEIILLQSQKNIYHFLNINDISQYFWNEVLPARIVRRGIDKFNIVAGERDANKIDHLIFVVPGIASGVVLKFRSDIEVINQLRTMGCNLLKSHYKNAYDQCKIGQIEVLPVSWQDQIHSPSTKIDEKLKTITLESLPTFRTMANNTVLDVLSYTSPFYCENIINTVGNTINENYKKFCEANPDFNGHISLIGHSLGGLILFDLLCNQECDSPHRSSIRSTTSDRVYLAGTGQTLVKYPQLLFVPHMCFALGSPIGLFVAVRDTDTLGLDFKLPTCSSFYNIFHPFDPIAYRIEGLVNPELGRHRPVEIPYHKGGKRKHLELKDTMVRVKNELKQKVFITYKNIFDKLASSSKMETTNEDIKMEVDEIIQLHQNLENSNSALTSSNSVDSGILNSDFKFGELNNSKRIDYVLQAGPFEVINEYLFALNSHVAYWDSEDTIWFILQEIYSSLGAVPENVN